MNKVFEDEFMEVQSGLIELCMEVTSGKVDKIFAYCSNEKTSKAFNAFFEVNGEIKNLHELGVPNGLIKQFLRLGTNDVDTLDTLGEKHNRRIPTEMKLFYDVKSGRFDARYKYESICSTITGIRPDDVYKNWINEMKTGVHIH